MEVILKYRTYQDGWPVYSHLSVANLNKIMPNIVYRHGIIIEFFTKDFWKDHVQTPENQQRKFQEWSQNATEILLIKEEKNRNFFRKTVHVPVLILSLPDIGLELLKILSSIEAELSLDFAKDLQDSWYPIIYLKLKF